MWGLREIWSCGNGQDSAYYRTSIHSPARLKFVSAANQFAVVILRARSCRVANPGQEGRRRGVPVEGRRFARRSLFEVHRSTGSGRSAGRRECERPPTRARSGLSLRKTQTATLLIAAIVVAPCLYRLARPVAATNIEDAAGRALSAVGCQLSFQHSAFTENFFAKCKEVTEEKLIRRTNPIHNRVYDACGPGWGST